MTYDHKTAARVYIAGGMIPEAIKVVHHRDTDEASAVLQAWMRENGVKQVEVLDDAGLKVGSIGLGDDKSVPAVDDEKALLAWCEREHPEHVQTVSSVRPAYVTKLLKDAEEHGEAVDVTTGAAVPGIVFRPVKGGLRRSYERDAKTRLQALVRSGQLPQLPSQVERP